MQNPPFRIKGSTFGSRVSFDDKPNMINPIDRYNYDIFDGDMESVMTSQEYEAKCDECTHVMVWEERFYTAS